MRLIPLRRSFTIRFRMLGAIAVVLLLLALLGGVGMLSMFRIHGLSEEFVGKSYAHTEQLNTLRSQLAQVRLLEKDMVIQYEKTEAVRKLHGDWNAALQQADKTGSGIAGTASAADAGLVRSLQAKLRAYQEQFDSIANQLESSGYESATTANRMSARAVAQFDEADKLLGALEASLRGQVDEAVRQEGAIARQTQWLFVAAVLLTILVVVPLTLLNMVSICRPLEAARRTALAIAQGNLARSAEADAEGRDEVADLQRAQESMRAGLAGLVAQVRGASENIATASQEIASGNHDLSSRTEQTAANVQETVASIGQVTTNVQQTAQSAQLANQLAATASQAAMRGGTVVGQAVSSMHEISASSRKINDIIGVIDGIAFQTNILALNAAVEAARAGEQGRGFAVVTGEVRSLAQRSAEAAKEIKGLIGTSTQAVDGGVRQVEDAGRAMQEIVSGVQRVTDIIGEITAAAAEQSGGIAQVNQSVGEIDRMTQQNAALVEESAAAAESLREQAARLAEVVRQFRLDAAQLQQYGGASPVALPGGAVHDGGAAVLGGPLQRQPLLGGA
ncbi:methyl-accepting chemotaxis protein [Xylophilus sp.]|uniref:methyl-accepting chemotaxis protein n=1 Tax=Xylophilus sp. TaxID=2653893 RepID=UPI002D7EF848|nr:methyl-accepting chemotaxis protein [Xylophilus sp.]